MHFPTLNYVFLIAALTSCISSQSFAQDKTVDFNRDIRPILSDNCFLCHGPAESTREADLRLDVREAAVDSGALIPGKPNESEIVERVYSDDEDLVMPPVDSNKRLTNKQRELLKQWVAEGAEYQEHWSFVAPQKSTQLDSDKSIDHFVEKTLHAEGLNFSPQADLRTLIRRVTFDLTGLPPTLAEVDSFLKDATAGGVDVAFEAVVDRLLATSAYGERMALAWLDAARYGDTSVMHADGPRDMWPWRDWVINAYNANMPFDQFTVEQLSGDLIPDATVEQKIASGFNRNHATSDEGGAFPEELRVDYVVDRVQTTATVWLGLTLECAQCHDHKYDPLSQEEYYKFFAYFNNTADPGMQTRNGNQSPTVDVIDKIRAGKLAELMTKIEATKKQRDEYKASVETTFVAWAKIATEKATADDNPVKELTGLTHWFPLDETDGKELKNKVTGSIATLEKGKLTAGEREGNKTLKLDGRTSFLCTEKVPELKRNNPFSFAAWIKYDGKSGGAVFSKMDVAQNHRGYDLWIQGSNIGTHIINSWPGNALKVVSTDALKANTWQHVVVTYDGRAKADGVKIYIDGKLSKNKVEQDSLTRSITAKVPFKIGSRSEGANWKGEVDDIRIYDRSLQSEEVSLAKGDVIGGILGTATKERTESQVETLRNYFLANEDTKYRKLSTALANVSKQHANLNAKPMTTMVMKDNPKDKMRMTYVLDRGQYDSPNKEKTLQPGVPAALPALVEDSPQNRLGLAQWLVRPDHPLTARVAVNRYWMILFGNGLVRTVGDFGAQGVPPSHPELLDWLAVDFVESKWDVKRMLKQIVMSKAYRQSSRQEKLHLEKDPTNRLLARAPRFRLQGEFIRDQSLALSGLLFDSVGGPSVKPYQPVNIWNEVSINKGLRYTQDKGEKLYRKSMYTYWKRSAPMPNMMIFDAPSREKCVVQRARTNTPLQALVTLNDPQFVEAARALAQRLIKTETNESKRIDLAYQLATARHVTQRELEVLLNLLADQRKRFVTDPESAKKFLAVGDSKRDESIDIIEHAAWAVIAQIILNLDETLSRG
ncbi:MAG: hypothetical protein ACI87E_000036 [Mariniblastus sp.]|jgi:hypothetical protein